MTTPPFPTTPSTSVSALDAAPGSPAPTLVPSRTVTLADGATLLLAEAGTGRPVLLLVWGESDRIVTPAYGRAYADSFGTGAELVVVSAAGHLPHLEQPSATYAVLDRIVAARG